MTENTQICRRCICNSRTHGVTINPEGVCLRCAQNDSQSRYDLGAFKQRMEDEFEAVKNTAVSYHVLSMFSGGKDSSYLLYLLKKKYGLRPLAFSVIHPFVNELSIKNMDRVSKQLGVDLIKFHIDDDMVKQVMSYSIQHAADYGLGEMFGCTTCSTIYHKLALIMAIQMGIPYILDGTDPTQSAIPLPIFIAGDRLKSFLLDGPQQPIDLLFEDALDPSHKGGIYDFSLERFRDRAFPTKISPFTIIGYNCEQNIKELEEAGLLTTEEANPEATNCDLLHLWSYISFKRFDSHPYTTHISQALRRNVPTLVDQFFVEGSNKVNRDQHIRILDEYKRLLYFLVEHPGEAQGNLKQLRKKVPTILAHMGEDHLNAFLPRVDRIHHYADYFGINLDTIESRSPK